MDESVSCRLYWDCARQKSLVETGGVVSGLRPSGMSMDQGKASNLRISLCKSTMSADRTPLVVAARKLCAMPDVRARSSTCEARFYRAVTWRRFWSQYRRRDSPPPPLLLRTVWRDDDGDMTPVADGHSSTIRDLRPLIMRWRSLKCSSIVVFTCR